LSTLPVVAEAGSGQPTFIFEDDGIATQAEANAIAASLLSRLQKQQQGGFCEIVGRPEIRPFDTVRLPDAQGGGQFLVDNVEHRLSGSEGFISRLSLAAPI
jgi:phage protein D